MHKHGWKYTGQKMNTVMQFIRPSERGENNIISQQKPHVLILSSHLQYFAGQRSEPTNGWTVIEYIRFASVFNTVFNNSQGLLKSLQNTMGYVLLYDAANQLLNTYQMWYLNSLWCDCFYEVAGSHPPSPSAHVVCFFDGAIPTESCFNGVLPACAAQDEWHIFLHHFTTGFLRFLSIHLQQIKRINFYKSQNEWRMKPQMTNGGTTYQHRAHTHHTHRLHGWGPLASRPATPSPVEVLHPAWKLLHPPSVMVI